MNVKLKQKQSDGSLSATARRWLIVCLLSLLGCPINASADCPSPQNPSEIPTPSGNCMRICVANRMFPWFFPPIPV